MNPIKKQIQKLCPHIMRVNKGCMVRGTSAWNKKRRSHEFLTVEGEYLWDNSVGGVVIYAPPHQDVIENKESIEVLGHVITLSVVLQAVKAVMDLNKPRTRMWLQANIYGSISSKWDFRKDNFDDQSEETQQFIGTLLGVCK